jgi:ribosomal protein S18 acetylase RimI-like enzyme
MFVIRPIEASDLEFVRSQLRTHWADTGIWSLGRKYQADTLPGFVAVDSAGSDSPHPDRLGLVTYIIHSGGFNGEVITLSSRSEDHGVGTALLDAAVQSIREAGCCRAFLTTTNDNLRALGFYQKRGWKLAALHKGIIDEARKRKPVIPAMGLNNIPLRDEIELELWLQD